MCKEESILVIYTEQKHGKKNIQHKPVFIQKDIYLWNSVHEPASIAVKNQRC